MKFSAIQKPRVFTDWNNEGTIELSVGADGISLKVLGSYNFGVLTLGSHEATAFADGLQALAKKTSKASVKISGDAECFIQAQETNDGEPYRSGVRITVGVEDQWQDQVILDFDCHEASSLASALTACASAQALS
jgi:hypothetical protein